MSQTNNTHLPIDRLLEYVQRRYGEQSALQTYAVESLTGGFAGSSVLKIELHLAHSDTTSAAFVQKFTTAAEVRVMKRLAEDIELADIPTLVDWHVTEDGEQDTSSWFVVPFYGGSLLDEDDDLPASILRALARVHAFYSTRSHEFNWLPHADGAFIRNLLNYVTTCLDQNSNRFPAPLVSEVAAALDHALASSLFQDCYERLPKTLTHGDVHAGNVVGSDLDRPVLLDWGNARIAPAMLDIANTVEIDSPAWDTYMTAWETVTGKSVDVEAAQLGYDWATAVVNIQYLPFALAHLDAFAVQAMIGKIQTSLAALRQHF